MEQEMNLILNVMKCCNEISQNEEVDFIISNTFLYLLNKHLIETYGEYDLKKIATEMNQYNSKESIKQYCDYLDTLSIDDIRKIICLVLSEKFYHSYTFDTFSSTQLSELVLRLLENNNKDGVLLDIGSGYGNFIANAYNYDTEHDNKIKNILGIEFVNRKAYLSNMALQIIRVNEMHPFVKCGSALDDLDIEYDLAYTFPPLGLKFTGGDKILNSKYEDIKFSNKNSSEWIFIDRMLRENPKRAIALTAIKTLYNSADKKYRDRLIKEGLIEGIIELPSGILNFSGIKTCLLIFGKGNKSIKFVDASKACKKTNKSYSKINILIDEIIDLYNKKDVVTKTLEESIYCENLAPSSALLKVNGPINGVPLREKATIFTGSQYTVRNFEDMFTNDDTGYKILTSSDIIDGLVNWENLQKIDYKDDKFDKFAIQKNDLIVTSKSSKVKTAVVDIEPKEKILVTGGMIIVRPNIEELDPTFLKIYLDSKQGQLALKAIQKGDYIVTINAKSLEDILIPNMEITKQRQKARLYNEKLSTLLAYKKEVERIENNLSNFYFDEINEE